MKNFILKILFLFFGITSFAIGQEQATIKFGSSLANISGKDVSNKVEWKGGIVLGTSFITRINKQFSFEPELTYIENGYIDGETTYDYNFFNFSFLAKMNIEQFIPLPDNNISIFALAGPVLAAQVNVVRYYKDEKVAWDAWDPLDPWDERDRNQEVFDIGLMFGAGAGYTLNFGVITFETRYNMGFTEPFENSKFTHQAWSFLLGYSLNLTD